MKLIINADDFGLSKSISDGIIDGILGGYITSTSIMVNMDYAKYAINKAIENKINCIGLHINLTVGKPVTKNMDLTDDNGTFLYNKNQINNPNLTYEDVHNEIMAQIELFNKYSEGKVKLDHLNCHHHLYDNPNILKALIDIATDLNLPIRNENNVKHKCPDILYMDFTIKNVNIDAIKKMIDLYKNDNVVVELCTHSGYVDDYTKTVTSYLGREEELKVLKEAKKIGLFDNIELINYKEF